MLIRHLIVLFLIIPFYVYAETPPPSYIQPSSIISTESMLQMVGSLLLVLIIIGIFAWALKRFAINPATASGVIKIIATTGVGQRERIVLVEIENTRLVLGVAPGRINTLHCMEESSEKFSNDKLSKLATDKFSGQLNQSIKKTHDQ